MRILNQYFPGGKKAALTMSYDDGPAADRRLVEIFDRYGIRGTFHLNAFHFLENNDRVKADEVPSLYKNHEVSCHLFDHPHPDICPDSVLVKEVWEDRKAIEAACGYTVRGMSYPFGNYNAHAIGILRGCGMNYARTTKATGAFSLPEDFMLWHPTAHHSRSLDICELFDKLKASYARYLRHDVLYVWGHSYEFDNDNNWDLIERFCDKAAGNDDIWYATNIEIFDYETASRRLEVGADGNTVFNPSAISVWVGVDGDPVEIKPGENRLK